MVNPLDIAVADFLDVLDNVSPNLLPQHPALAERVEALRAALTFAELKHAKGSNMEGSPSAREGS